MPGATLLFCKDGGCQQSQRDKGMGAKCANQLENESHSHRQQPYWQFPGYQGSRQRSPNCNVPFLQGPCSLRYNTLVTGRESQYLQPNSQKLPQRHSQNTKSMWMHIKYACIQAYTNNKVTKKTYLLHAETS